MKNDTPWKSAPISETLKVIFEYTKTNQEATFEWRELAEVLGPLYYPELRLIDVLSIVMKVYEEALMEPRFELPGRHHAAFDIVTAPIKGHFSVDMWGPKTSDVAYTVDQFYTSIIKKMLSDLRLTNVGWLREKETV